MTFKKQGEGFFIGTASSEIPDIERGDLEQALKKLRCFFFSHFRVFLAEQWRHDVTASYQTGILPNWLLGFPNRWTLWNSILPRGFSIRSLFSRNLNTKSLVSSGGESTSEAGTTSSISKNLTFSLLVSEYNNCLRRSFISNFDSFDYFFRSEMSSSLKCRLCLSGQSAKRRRSFPHRSS